MTRAFDFVVAGVIYCISAIIHLIGIHLFAPGSALWGIATDGTAVMNGTALANQWYQIIVIWMPLLAAGGISCWVMIREYRRQVATAARARPR